MRGWPVLSSHFFPGEAPQVGQRTVSTCFGLSFLFMVRRRRDNPSKPMHKNGQSWTLYTLTGNPDYVDGELIASLSAIVSRMEQRSPSFVGTIEICGVFRIRMAIYL
jgi:hypothetical protein